MSTEQFLLSAWTWNPVVLAVAAAGLAGLSLCFRAERRLGWLLLALVIFVVTLVSPLNALADGYLFSAHMLQHILLLLIVPGLLLLSLPRSLSLAWRPRILAHPLAGWIAGVGAMWFWHWPTLCNAAVTSRFGLCLANRLAPRPRDALLESGHRAAGRRTAFAAGGGSLSIQRLRHLQRARDHSHFFAGDCLFDLRDAGG